MANIRNILGNSFGIYHFINTHINENTKRLIFDYNANKISIDFIGDIRLLELSFYARAEVEDMGVQLLKEYMIESIQALVVFKCILGAS